MNLTEKPVGNTYEPSGKKKIHELNDGELDNYWVSMRSQFKDELWSFVSHTPGLRPSDSELSWRFKLYDGSRLTDLQHTLRLRWAKILTLTLLVLPAKGRPLSPGSMPALRVELKWLISWMSEREYHLPSELTPLVVKQYVDELPEFINRNYDSEEISGSVATRALMSITRLWDQRLALKKMGIVSLISHPLNGKGAYALAETIATKARGWIKPLPDEVAIPLLNKAAWFLDTPASDVLRLLDIVRDPLAGSTVPVKKAQHVANCIAGAGRSARHRRNRKFLDEFQFSVPFGESEPWHEPLSKDYGTSTRTSQRMRRVMELWEALRDAAAIIVQSTSGMRISELLGILPGIDQETGLPSRVRVEQSLTGLYEWFIIRSALSKTDEGLPSDVDWVLGMRPIGSDEIPLAVQALSILNKIYEPWRDAAKTQYLFLSKGFGAGLALASAELGPLSNDALNKSLKRFIRRWVDLSKLPNESVHRLEENDLVRWRESKGAIFSTHMLRKSWAQFTLACDARLLPAIQMQFHHLNLAMTEGSYIGRNPLLIEALDSISLQKRNLMLFESLTGRTSLAGRMGEQLEREMERFRAEVGDLPNTQKWLRTVQWADSCNLQMFFSAHATCCPTRTSEMRCHDAAGTSVWIRKEPNNATREPNLCAGCACAVMDSSHEPFWSSRYIDCQLAIRKARSTGTEPEYFREIKFRAEQARTILKKFGANLEALEARIVSSLDQGYA